MSYAAPVFLAACTYSLGMTFLSVSKENTYDHLHDQVRDTKEVMDRTLDSAKHNPRKLALLGDYNSEVLSRRSVHLTSSQMLTPNEALQELNKLDRQLTVIQRISPFDLLSRALFGNARSWRRERPVSL